MNARTVEIVLVGRLSGKLTTIRFDLVCHPNASIVEGQTFEIVAPGHESVRATPMHGQVTNRSDGTTSARMMSVESDLAVVVPRLQRLPNVSNIRHGRF